MNEEELLATEDFSTVDGAAVHNSLPDEVQEELNIERNMILSAAPLIDHILEWFDEQISYLNTLEGLDLNKDLQLQVYGRKFASDKLAEAKSSLEIMRDSYLQNHE